MKNTKKRSHTISDLKKIASKIEIQKGSQIMKENNGNYTFVFLGLQSVPFDIVNDEAFFYLRTPDAKVYFFKKLVGTKQIQFLTYFNQGAAGKHETEDPIYAIFDKHSFYTAILIEDKNEVHSFQQGGFIGEISMTHDFVGMAKTFLRIHGKSTENVNFIIKMFDKNSRFHYSSEDPIEVFNKIGIH